MLSLLGALYRNKSGNFGIATAFMLPMLLMAVGLGIDFSEMSRKREDLQQAVDAAALGAASSLATNGITTEQAKALAASFVRGHLAGTPAGAQDMGTPDVEVVPTTPTSHNKAYKVTVKTSYNVPMSGFQALLGFHYARVAAVGVAESETESRNALSMYLVLDRSGSMQWVTTTVDSTQSSCNNYYEKSWPKATYQSPCYINKISSLKSAVAALTSQFETTDPNHELVRTGAVSYSSAANPPSPLAWGTSAATTYVNALTASGSTNSTAAFQTAYNGLTAATEDAAHSAKTGLVPSKFILFMTDGQNDNANIDTATKSLCDQAKAAGIKIYSVAFSAPTIGKQLLSYCSSGSSYYFEATNMPQLVAVFREIGAKTSKLSNRLTQ